MARSAPPPGRLGAEAHGLQQRLALPEALRGRGRRRHGDERGLRGLGLERNVLFISTGCSIKVKDTRRIVSLCSCIRAICLVYILNLRATVNNNTYQFCCKSCWISTMPYLNQRCRGRLWQRRPRDRIARHGLSSRPFGTFQHCWPGTGWPGVSLWGLKRRPTPTMRSKREQHMTILCWKGYLKGIQEHDIISN